MGAATLGWKDVRVDVKGSGEPQIICATRTTNDQLIEHEAKLSISHDGDYAVATVLAAALPEIATSRAPQDDGVPGCFKTTMALKETVV